MRADIKENRITICDKGCTFYDKMHILFVIFGRMTLLKIQKAKEIQDEERGCV